MALGTTVALCCIIASSSAHRQSKPHVVFFLADDYGWANFGAHLRDLDGSDPDVQQLRKEVHTPNMDLLVQQGMLLERHYTYKICSPTRSSLQVGRLPAHVNAINTGVTVANLSDPVSGFSGIPRNMTGVAEKLRLAGYRTHMVGKWDAGMATPEHSPRGRGYESWLGYFQHANDYWRQSMPIDSTGEVDNCLNMFTDLFMQNSTYCGGVRDGPSTSLSCLKDPESDPACYEEYLFKQRALQVVREHDTSRKDSPLFLFYAFHLLHTPLQVPESYVEKIDKIVADAKGSKFSTRNRRLYAAMTLYMDDAIGEMVQALKRKAMWDNTLIVFIADNGGPIYVPGSANNYPLKGGKYSDFEGGIRTNAFVSGGFVPATKRGSKFAGIVSVADWYGTLCDIAGVNPTDQKALDANMWLSSKGLPLLAPVDSVAQWQYMLKGSNGREGPLYLSDQALLLWPYKLVTGRQPYSVWTGPLYPNCSTIASSNNGTGPMFYDFKVFNHVIEPALSKEALDRMQWTFDCGAGCLFNVDLDPNERNDLADQPQHAATLAKMQDLLRKENAGHFAPARGVPQLSACENSIDVGGFYGPFLNIEGWYSPLPPKTATQKLKDAALKAELRLLNKDIVEQGVLKIAERFAPQFTQNLVRSMDQCLPNYDASEAIFI